jgi:hypothetical protein
VKRLVNASVRFGYRQYPQVDLCLRDEQERRGRDEGLKRVEKRCML